MTDEQKQQLLKLLETTDLPLTEIAKEMGMSFGTLKLRMAESHLKVGRTLIGWPQ
jgi:DNA-directed RNA polymerase specialized sigma24 family protein